MVVIVIFPQFQVMSTYTLSQISLSETGTPNLQQQPKLLEDALAVVKQQGFYMRKSIVSPSLWQN